MLEDTKTPQIRFKGFNEPWTETKLGELGEIITGSTPSTLKPEYYSENGIPWITPTDINSSTISDSPKKLSVKGAKVGRVVPPNTILCTCIASIGKNTLLTVKGSFNQQINALIPNTNNDAYFLLAESELWSNKMKLLAAAGTMQIVNKTEFAEITTMLPTKVEQEKIGNFFASINSFITLNEQKHEKLVQTKRAMLSKMFPKAGECVPELRFKDFTDPWQQCKFSSIAKLNRGLTYSPSDLVASNTGIRVLRSSNILEDKFVLHDDDVFVSEKAVNIDFANEGDILITAANGSTRLVGKRAKITNLPTKAVHGGFMLLAKTDDPNFLNAAMGASWYTRFLNIGVSGGNGAIGNLDKDALSQQELPIPSFEERQQIGSFFSNLDSLITLAAKKVDVLKNIKRAMLDKMFV